MHIKIQYCCRDRVLDMRALGRQGVCNRNKKTELGFLPAVRFFY